MTYWRAQARAARQRTQIDCARLVLDRLVNSGPSGLANILCKPIFRSTVLLVSSTKCVLRHPESVSARENRDTVFCQMRRAIDLIHFVIREGVSPDQNIEDMDLMDLPGVSYQDTMSSLGNQEENSSLDSQTSIIGALRHFENSVDMMRMSSVSSSYCEQVLIKIRLSIEEN